MAGQTVEVACRGLSWVWYSERLSKGAMLGVGEVRESKAVPQSGGDLTQSWGGLCGLTTHAHLLSITWSLEADSRPGRLWLLGPSSITTDLGLPDPCPGQSGTFKGLCACQP